MKNKLISSIIIICITLGMFGALNTYAENTNDYQRNLSVLQGVGVVYGNDFENSPLKVAKKSTFINFLMNLVSENGFGEATDESALIMAEQLEVISDASKIGNDTLKHDEMIKMGVSVLGYQTMAQHNGGYPIGYITIGNRIGITDGLTGKEEITNSEMMQCLVNIIKADCMKRTSWDDEGGNYEIKDDVGILEVNRNIVPIKGFLDANSLGGIYGGNGTKAGQVSIDGVTYLTGNTNAEELLGYQVFAYGKKTRDDITTLLYIEKARKVTTKEISLEQIDKVSDGFDVVTYYEKDNDSRAKEIKLEKPFAFLLNGKSYSEYTTNDFIDGDGYFTFVDNNGNGRYDVIYLNRYESMIVRNTAQREQVIYNQMEDNSLLPVLKLGELSEDSGTIEIIRNGEKADFSAITVDDVVDVYQTKGNGRNKIRLIVNSGKKVSEIIKYNKSIETIYTEDGEYLLSDTYKRANELSEAYAIQVVPGAEYILYLNAEQKVVGLKRGVTEGFVKGYLRAYAEEGVFDTELKLRVLTEKGNWETLEVAESLKINGEGRGTPEKLKQAIDTAGDCPGIISFKLNEDGQVNAIELPQLYQGVKEEERLTETSELKLNYRGGNQSFSSQYYLAAGASVFIIPKDSRDDEKLYRVGTVSNLVNDREYIFKGYDVDDYRFMNAITIEATDAECKEVGMEAYFVTQKGSVLQSNGDIASILYVVSNSYRELTLLGEDIDTFDNVKIGDVIKVSSNANGYVNKVTTIYSMENGELKVDGTQTHSSSVFIQGEILKADGQVGRILLDCGAEKALRVSTGLNVVIYDAKTEQVIYGTLNDVMQGDYVIADSVWSQIRNIFLIRN